MRRRKNGVKRPTRYYSNRQEKSVSKHLGGRTTVNSGAGKFSGGDVLTDNILVECKTVTKPQASFSIRKDWLEKVKGEALSLRKPFSCLAFSFEPDGKNYYVIDDVMMKILIEKLEE